MSFHPVLALKLILPSETQPRILRALRRDNLVWQALHSREFLEQAAKLFENNPDSWTPASLALIAIDNSGSANDRAVNHGFIATESLRRQAAASLETAGDWVSNSGRLEPDLKEAGLLAVGLSERYRITADVDDILKLIGIAPKALWQSVVAILFGLLPDFQPLINALIANPQESLFRQYALHAILANPLSLEEQVRVGMLATFNAPHASTIQLIRSAAELSPEYSVSLACGLIAELPAPSSDSPPSSILFQADLFQLANRQAESLKLLERVWEESRKNQMELHARLAQSAAEANDTETALLAVQHAQKIMPELAKASEAIALAQLQTGQLIMPVTNEEALPEYQPEYDLPTQIALALASLASGQVEQAVERARQATARLTQDVSSNTPQPAKSQLVALAKLLCQHGHPFNATQVCQQILLSNPTHSLALVILGQSQLALNEFQSAINTAELLLGLEPDNSAALRILGQSLARLENTSEALSVWKQLLATQESPTPEDLIEAAQIALTEEAYPLAAQLSQRLLHLQPNHYDAQFLLGAALQFLGDHRNAQFHFERATELQPAIPMPWLKRIELAGASNKLDLAADIARQALAHNPEEASLWLALGQAQLQTAEPNKAVNSLLQAQKFLRKLSDTKNPELTSQVLKLSELLSQLQYEAEARSVLEFGRQSFPFNTEIAYALASSYRLGGNKPGAIQLLRDIAKSPNSNLQILLDLVELLLDTDAIQEEIQWALERATSLSPDNPAVMASQALAMGRFGDSETAIAELQILLQSDYGKDPANSIKLTQGLSEAALRSGKPELAIAALQEHLPISSGHPALLKMLFEAYRQSGLQANALQVLGELISQDICAMETLFWVASKALELDKINLALNALERAHALDPDSPEAIFRLGYTAIKSGDLPRGKRILTGLIQSDNPGLANLRAAAIALMEIGDTESSRPYLERALEICNGQSPEVLADLVQLHLQQDQVDQALAMLDKQIALQPDRLELLLSKAEVLNTINRPQSALLVLQSGLTDFSNRAELHHELAISLIKNSELESALSHAKQAQSLAPENALYAVQVLEISHLGLATPVPIELLQFDITSLPVASQLLVLQHLLAHGYEIEVSNTTNQLTETNISEVGVLALQATLSNRINLNESAIDLLEQAIIAFGDEVQESLNAIPRGIKSLALANAAAALHQYEIALYFARLACNLIPEFARPHLVLASILALRAEQQNLCHALSIQAHAPGRSALHTHAQQSFEIALEQASSRAIDKESIELAQWTLRGDWALCGAVPALEALVIQKANPDVLAGGIAALRRAGNKLTTDIETLANQGNEKVQFQLALFSLKTSPAQGCETAEAILREQPTSPQAAMLTAILNRRANRLSRAAECMRLALASWPDEPRWQSIAGEIMAELGILPAAIQHLEKSIHLDPENVSTQILLGKTYLRDSAPGNAVRILEAIRANHSNIPELWETLAEAYLLLNESDMAGECANRWQNLTPETHAPYLLMARITLLQRDYQKGLDLVTRAIEQYSAPPTARKLQARLLIHLGRHVEAMEALDNAIDLAMDPVPFMLERANVLREISGDQPALEYLVTIAENYPEKPLVYAAMSTILAHQQQLSEAIRLSRRGLRTAELELLPTEQRAFLHFQLGSLLRQSGQLDQAVHHLSQALSHSPGQVDTYLELAEAYDCRREQPKALEYFRKAIAISPKDIRPYLGAGKLLKDSHNFADAEVMFERAIALQPNDAEIRRQLIAVATANFVHQTHTSNSGT